MLSNLLNDLYVMYSHNNPVKEVLFSSPFYKERNWGMERFSECV